MAKATRKMVVVENVNVPGYSFKVDAAKYQVMKAVLLRILPKKPPGMTQAEMRNTVVAHLPHSEFPGGAKAEWWSKCVQLDLEAKGLVKRDPDSKPLRWYRDK